MDSSTTNDSFGSTASSETMDHDYYDCQTSNASQGSNNSSETLDHGHHECETSNASQESNNSSETLDQRRCECTIAYGRCKCAFEKKGDAHYKTNDPSHAAPAIWWLRDCEFRSIEQKEAYQPCPRAFILARHRSFDRIAHNFRLDETVSDFCCSEECCQAALAEYDARIAKAESQLAGDDPELDSFDLNFIEAFQTLDEDEKEVQMLKHAECTRRRERYARTTSAMQWVDPSSVPSSFAGS